MLFQVLIQILIRNVEIFDVYEGENIPENQKSIAINVQYNR